MRSDIGMHYKVFCHRPATPARNLTVLVGSWPYQLTFSYNWLNNDILHLLSSRAESFLIRKHNHWDFRFSLGKSGNSFMKMKFQHFYKCTKSSTLLLFIPFFWPSQYTYCICITSCVDLWVLDFSQLVWTKYWNLAYTSCLLELITVASDYYAVITIVRLIALFMYSMYKSLTGTCLLM